MGAINADEKHVVTIQVKARDPRTLDAFRDAVQKIATLHGAKVTVKQRPKR